MSQAPERWSQPFAALLGAYDAQIGFGLPSIGGKDSMSGTFETMDVPPTLVSFAVCTAKLKDLITPEFKKPGSRIVWIRMKKDGYQMPDYAAMLDAYEKVRRDIGSGRIISAYTVGRFGIAEAVSKMAFGNNMGIIIRHNVSPVDFFSPNYADLICEVREEMGRAHV